MSSQYTADKKSIAKGENVEMKLIVTFSKGGNVEMQKVETSKCTFLTFSNVEMNLIVTSKYVGIDFSVASSKDTIRDIKAVKGADFDIYQASLIDFQNDYLF